MADTPFKVGKYQVTVLRDKCIGAATCVAVSPAVYKLDEENKAVYVDGGTDTPENTLLAAQSCPVAAIVVVDTETQKQVWPL